MPPLTHSLRKYLMQCVRKLPAAPVQCALGIGLCVAGARTAHAEGTAQLGTSQALRAGSVLYVDVVDANAESLHWTGAGSVTVLAPNGSSFATLNSGGSVAASGGGAGAYRITVNQAQSIGSTWDVAVKNGGTELPGRLHSYNWTFDAGSYAQSAATNGSFYALVDGGSTQYRPVIELRLAGLAGYVYDINANRQGVDGANAGHSVPMSGNNVTPEFPIYLSPPALATYDHGSPAVFGFSYVGGASTSRDGAAISPCQLIAPGVSEGYFQFTSQVSGSYHLQCDVDNDGQFRNDGSDLLIIGSVAISGNTVPWNGTHNGVAVNPGDYNCRLATTVGEFHYVARDVETSYQGMRMYELNSNGTRAPLSMFWDDSLVQSMAVAMPNGNYGAVTGGANGMSSGEYNTAAVADVNARAWGGFIATGKGNNTYLDTYVWLDRATSTTLTIGAVNPLTDSDGDGAGDFIEQCDLGTDPGDADSDDDGTPDGTQYLGTTSTAQNGGLESNNRMASALAARAIAQMHGRMPRYYRQGSALAPWLSGVGLNGLTTVTAVPGDLPLVTNATSTAGVDFVDGQGRRRGSMLLVATQGAQYEHSKEVCDRAHGAALEAVGQSNVGDFGYVWGRYRRAAENQTEVSTTLRMMLDPAQPGGYRAYATWLADALPSVPAGSEVITVQLWAADAATLQVLVRNALAAWRARQLVTAVGAALPSVNHASDAQLDGNFHTAAPTQFFREGHILGRKLTLTTETRANASATGLRVVGINAQGQQEVMDLPLQASGAMQLPLFADVTVEMYNAAGVVDRMWLSDGAWAQYFDSDWGGATQASFTSGCSWQTLTTADAVGATQLAGCAHADITAFDQTAGVARHLARPVSLQSQTLFAHVNAQTAGRVCVESAALRRASCAAMPAGQGWMAWPARAFDGEVLATASLITFTVDNAAGTSLEVAGLGWAAQAPAGAVVLDEATGPATPSDDDSQLTAGVGAGCSASGSGNPGLLVLSVLAALGLVSPRSRRQR